MFKLLLLAVLVLFVVPFVSGFFPRGGETLLRFTTKWPTIYLIKVSSWGYDVKEFVKKLVNKYVQL